MKTQVNRRKYTHYTRLIEYLYKFNSITSLEAIQDLGNTRISATVFELRKDGFDINTDMIEVPNRFQTTTQVAKYSIKWNDNQLAKIKKLFSDDDFMMESVFGQKGGEHRHDHKAIDNHIFNGNYNSYIGARSYDVKEALSQYESKK